MKDKLRWVIPCVFNALLLMPFLKSFEQLFGSFLSDSRFALIYYPPQLLICFLFMATGKIEAEYWLAAHFLFSGILMLMLWLEKYSINTFTILKWESFRYVEAGAALLINLVTLLAAAYAARLVRAIRKLIRKRKAKAALRSYRQAGMDNR